MENEDNALHRVFKRSIEVFGNESDAEYWLDNKLIKAFGVLFPSQVVLGGGEQEVLEYLDRADSECS